MQQPSTQKKLSHQPYEQFFKPRNKREIGSEILINAGNGLCWQFFGI